MNFPFQIKHHHNTEEVAEYLNLIWDDLKIYYGPHWEDANRPGPHDPELQDLYINANLLGKDVHLSLRWRKYSTDWEMDLEKRAYKSSLSINYEDGELYPFHFDKGNFTREDEKEFIEEWTETCRRNLWLMGAKIESTSHEQMEWIIWIKDKLNVPSS